MPCYAMPSHAAPRSAAPRTLLIQSIKNSSRKKNADSLLTLRIAKKRIANVTKKQMPGDHRVNN